MKKTSAVVAFILLTAGSLFAFDATVVQATGKTEILKGEAWQPLSQGDTVRKGDVIQTGFKSQVILKIKESTVTMDSLSRLTVEQLAEKGTTDETRLFLDTGSLKSDVQKSENRRVGFTVKSPVATASVRGTMLTVANTFNGTDVSTQRGHVTVWKTNNDEAEIADDEDTTQAPDAGSEPTPRGAISVAAGQATAVSAGEAQASSTQTTATQAATAQAAATTTQASVEAVTQAATATQTEIASTTTTSSSVKTGTVTITAYVDSSSN